MLRIRADLEENVEYTAEVVLVNAAGVKAAAVTAGLWVDSTPPTVTPRESRAYCVTLNNDVGLVANWAGLFQEDGCVGSGKNTGDCLAYKYSIGISIGGGDVSRWVESSVPSLQLDAGNAGLIKDKTSGMVDNTVNYKITVQAFNLAGLGATETIDVRLASGEC